MHAIRLLYAVEIDSAAVDASWCCECDGKLVAICSDVCLSPLGALDSGEGLEAWSRLYTYGIDGTHSVSSCCDFRFFSFRFFVLVFVFVLVFDL